MPKKSVKRGVKGAGGAGNEDGGEAQDEDTFQCTLCMRHLHQDVLIEHFKVLHTNLPICVVPNSIPFALVSAILLLIHLGTK